MSRPGRKRQREVSLPPKTGVRADDDGAYLELADKQIPDSRGGIGVPYVKRSSKKIVCGDNPRLLAAWEQFDGDFGRARLTGYVIGGFEKVAQSSDKDGPQSRIVEARDYVFAAYDAVRQVSPRGAHLVWHCIGLDEPVAQHVGEGKLARKMGLGVLGEAVGLLALHYEMMGWR